MAKYYIKIVGRAFGPVEAERILHMVADGKLTRTSEISANRVDWFPIQEVPEFHGAFGASSAGAGSGSHDEAPVWFVRTNGLDQRGPMTREEVLDGVSSGQIPPTARAWRQGDPPRELGEIPAFASAMRSNAEKKEWYYSADGQTGYGPYTVSEILSFVERGVANFDSLVWRQGESSRPMRSEPAFMKSHDPAPSAVAPTSVAAAPVIDRSAGGGAGTDGFSPRRAAQVNSSLKRWRLLILIGFITAVSLWLLALAAFLLGTGLLVNGGAEDSSLDLTLSEMQGLDKMILAPMLLGVASIVLKLAFFVRIGFTYSFWSSIPKSYARTTRLKAALFLLIPVFRYYWNFVAYDDGMRDLDAALRDYQRRGLNQGEEPRKFKPGAGLFYAIYEILPFAILLFLLLTVGLATFTAVALFISICLYPFFAVGRLLVFYICSSGMASAAMQMNCWRAGVPSSVPDRRQPRVTLDDIMNS